MTRYKGFSITKTLTGWYLAEGIKDNYLVSMLCETLADAREWIREVRTGSN